MPSRAAITPPRNAERRRHHHRKRPAVSARKLWYSQKIAERCRRQASRAGAIEDWPRRLPIETPASNAGGGNAGQRRRARTTDDNRIAAASHAQRSPSHGSRVWRCVPMLAGEIDQCEPRHAGGYQPDGTSGQPTPRSRLGPAMKGDLLNDRVIGARRPPPVVHATAGFIEPSLPSGSIVVFVAAVLLRRCLDRCGHSA